MSNAIAAALLIPRAWRDLRLKPSPEIDASCATKARVIQCRESPKTFIVHLFSLTWGVYVSAVYFHAKGWQKTQFSTGRELILFGLTRRGIGGLEMIQPIVVSQTGAISPVYKRKMAKEALSLISVAALEKEGLPRDVAETLCNLHFPQTMPNLSSRSVSYALKFAEIFNFLRQLNAKKRDLPSLARIEADPAPFIRNLPFSLTDDQLGAIEDCRNDLAKPVQARRLIVGDVGCGKTAVMLAVAFMAKKAVIMVPTTLLAAQIYEEAGKLLKDLLSISLVTAGAGSKSEGLSAADLLIGTHALLHQVLPRVPCVMIDEQHRFGTNQRKLLGELTSGRGGKPHIFQFSATPIPRTLAMIESALLDISTIKTAPFVKRTTTKVIDKASFKELIGAIRDEIAANNQVLIVYPLIEASGANEYQSLEEAQGFWFKNFENVYVTHGKDREKERIILSFRDNGSILLATTVVEVGINLPRLTTVVVVGAERLGLATLHQLRGRVGRMGQNSRCFFYTNHIQNERLRALAETMDGFEVAELDLKNRMCGDLLSGEFQSGAAFNYFDLADDEEILAAAKKRISLCHTPERMAGAAISH
ncbi:MAG: ATP-dependent DNA helicase RecG [Helicobacteraceae bacterium]|jgi:ATP-dependent DNA helicase RecG|nr:ATP-dependent DNA helicase RecG [Helicobacteraceae bacterium]